MYLHLGPAPAGMRVRELSQPAAVVEVLRPDVQLDRLAQAQRAETRPTAARGAAMSPDPVPADQRACPPAGAGRPGRAPAPPGRTGPAATTPATPATPLPAAGPALVLLVGPAGSGKSTWAATRYQSTQILSLDGLRAAVADNDSDQRATAEAVDLLHALTAARLRHGRLTVIDATNAARSARAELLAIAAAAAVPAYAVVFITPVAVCLARNATRSPVREPGCGWARRVPAGVVVAQHAAAAAALPVLAGEGFTAVQLIHHPTAHSTTAPAGHLAVARRAS